MSKAPSVVLAGGGTAGHISPMLAIAAALTAEVPEAKLHMVGTPESMEARLVPEAGYEISFIPKVPFPRRPNLDALKFPLLFRTAIKEAARILDNAAADVVVGVGGYVCTPLYLAAQKKGIPVVIHEGNAKPGLANKVGAKKAAMVGTAFDNTPIAGARYVGMPMREEIATLDRAATRASARQELGLDADLPTLIVTGGSLGALSLNKTLKIVVPNLEEWGFQVLHITGRGKTVLGEDGQPLTVPHYHQVEFINGMQKVYAAADLLVVRAGAATVCEVAAVGIPAIFVPLPIGNGEQELNARALVDSGAAVLVKDSEFTPEWFSATVPTLIKSSDALAEMGSKSYTHGIRNAAQMMAHEILKAAQA
ncbi:undecaprenyldiphospho-muramoylpentapeptide beta-N-acetylglucosaminyltransferase [Rothia sp. ZJ932]|uniref:undecaprenyldiphospho-muramoylpentapeptide beta-N-acetylglucosaminyltransferase n=1 Tax=Rothia sp. ZJ932 TaxID=2810516 RepID=UPI001966CE80|nr:undecaprenyldiphospho-muramoylpentapeptide beta-N-acetylglucosaminyltransferase [Rothia sp. ZJ932]QRZ60936.1 undecaprenyldiphospho-muramoylpentapeptide beta-N-acetylglucosaminyltransferase [Rothia sp. ZJ932]